MAAVDMGIPVDMGMGWVRGLCESPWACGDSMEILNGYEIKWKCVRHVTNVVVDI